MLLHCACGAVCTCDMHNLDSLCACVQPYHLKCVRQMVVQHSSQCPKCRGPVMHARSSTGKGMHIEQKEFRHHVSYGRVTRSMVDSDDMRAQVLSAL